TCPVQLFLGLYDSKTNFSCSFPQTLLSQRYHKCTFHYVKYFCSTSISIIQWGMNR
uniref:Ovule protein n=1 Tax=Ascaris lumbricoides TaxID=6252 RepID=A0A0M3I916_ASCLU